MVNIQIISTQLLIYFCFYNQFDNFPFPELGNSKKIVLILLIKLFRETGWFEARPHRQKNIITITMASIDYRYDLAIDIITIY